MHYNNINNNLDDLQKLELINVIRDIQKYLFHFKSFFFNFPDKNLIPLNFKNIISQHSNNISLFELNNLFPNIET